MTLPDWAATGREVAVLGLGRSGLAATRLLRDRGIAVYVSDATASDRVEARGAEARKAGADVECGRHDLRRVSSAQAVILSPGIPPDAAPVVAAREAGLPVRAEIDLGLEALEGVPYIGVTGTNGKSTTTALVAHLLRAGGVRAVAAGNIGTPVSDVALWSELPQWLAIEFSSFQLHDTDRVAPQVGILTNLSPDHLDRYPHVTNYYDDKKLFFRNATSGSVWVTNADNQESTAITGGVAGHRLGFSVLAPADGWWDRDGDLLMIDHTAVLPRSEFSLLGDHNVANALAAALAVRTAVGATEATLAQGLRSFRALPHRLEAIAEIAGVRWINDSKATNLASTEVAVAALDGPFVLLLGGRHKGESYKRLLPLLGSRCVAVVAYGEAGARIAADLGDQVRVEHVTAGFDEVVSCAAAIAVAGNTVLLSPACSSYDMFVNFEQRGDRFRELVGAL